SEDNGTDMPGAGAGEFRVTVPVVVPPAKTEVGLSATLDAAGGLTIMSAVFTESRDAVTVTAVLVKTGEVETTKVPEIAPAGTVAVAGTVAATELLLES